VLSYFSRGKDMLFVNTGEACPSMDYQHRGSLPINGLSSQGKLAHQWIMA